MWLKKAYYNKQQNYLKHNMFHQTCEQRPIIAHFRQVDIIDVEYNAFFYRKIIKVVVLDRYSS